MKTLRFLITFDGVGDDIVSVVSSQIIKELRTKLDSMEMDRDIRARIEPAEVMTIIGKLV